MSFIANTGRTQGIKFRTKPPIRASATISRSSRGPIGFAESWEREAFWLKDWPFKTRVYVASWPSEGKAGGIEVATDVRRNLSPESTSIFGAEKKYPDSPSMKRSPSWTVNGAFPSSISSAGFVLVDNDTLSTPNPAPAGAGERPRA